MKTLLSTVLIASSILVLGACSRPGQTPLHQQERLMKNNFIATYSEDRITLFFDHGTSHLSEQQRDYINRFVNYYKGAKNTNIYVSLLRRPEQEDQGRLPFYNPTVRQALDNVTREVRKTGVSPHVIDEIEFYPDPDTIDARAWKGIVDSAGDHEKYADPVFNNYYNPDMNLLQNYTKVAVIVREYEVEAANCPQTGYWDWPNIVHVSDGITLGCANQKNFLAQVKHPERIVRGKVMDSSVSSTRPIERQFRNYDSGNDIELPNLLQNINN